MSGKACRARAAKTASSHKKTLHRDEHILLKRLTFGRVGLQIARILRQVCHPQRGHAVEKPSRNGGRLVGEKINPRPGSENPQHTRERLLFIGEEFP
jgi:hypothetical protein